MTPADLDWLRSTWSRSIVVKGIQTIEDARMVVDRGADAIVVSNDGGRQLDRAPTPLERLPGIVEAVGDRAEVDLDGGILSGSDTRGSTPRDRPSSDGDYVRLGAPTS